MSYKHEDDVGMYVHMMEYPKTLIPLVTSILDEHFNGYQAPMQYVMTLTDQYAKAYQTNYESIHEDVREYVGRYLLRAVFNVIDAHAWGTRHTSKITGMLLEFIFRDIKDQGRRFETVASNMYFYVDDAFCELH